MKVFALGGAGDMGRMANLLLVTVKMFQERIS